MAKILKCFISYDCDLAPDRKYFTITKIGELIYPLIGISRGNSQSLNFVIDSPYDYYQRHFAELMAKSYISNWSVLDDEFMLQLFELECLSNN